LTGDSQNLDQRKIALSVITCYNERATIGQLLARIKAAAPEANEIIVVDECSTDGTRELLHGQLASQIDRLICHERNRVKGAALRSGFGTATGQIVVVQYADLGYDPY